MKQPQAHVGNERDTLRLALRNLITAVEAHEAALSKLGLPLGDAMHKALEQARRVA
jgi:hypothetical protein